MAAETAFSLLGDLDSLTNDPKANEDFSDSVNQILPRIDALVEAGQIVHAIDEILTLEKKCRQASDAVSCSILCCKILKILNSQDDWEGLNDNLVSLCKKRGQLKRAIIDMVQLSMNWLENIPSPEIQSNFLNTLLGVTEGKIFVEVERARLIKISANKLEEAGKVDDAAVLLQDVQVETLGAMEKIEKTQYILEQMRLLLLKGDYIRFHIVSKKINYRLLETEEFQQIKLSYYQYLIKYYLHENQILNVCKCCYSILNTPCIQADKEERIKILEQYILYLLISPYTNEQQDMLNRLASIEKKKLDEIPTFKKLVQNFIATEIMPSKFYFENIIKSHYVFLNNDSSCHSLWNIFEKRIIQQNIRVIAKFYNQITLDRLASLLDITKERTEQEISEMVSSSYLIAKIDRPESVIRFGNNKNSTSHLSTWAYDIARGIDIIEETSHLIQKEQMVHLARIKKVEIK